MSVEQVYMQDSYLFELEAQITEVGIDERGNFLCLDRTIFHPQGGGQPADMGKIGDADITHVLKGQDRIKHYFLGQGPLVGETVHMKVDVPRRLKNAQYHSAGHLIAHVVEKHRPGLKAVKGHHYPNESYVEFEGALLEGDKDMAVLAEALSTDLHMFIKEGANVEVSQDGDGLRHVTMGTGPKTPCGGTHVKDLGILSEVHITKIKPKSGRLRFSYAVSRQ